jgi:DNA-binding IclR family transcriptional regulator
MLIKDRILKLLQKQKEGLTITDVTKILQTHYSTSSKYLAVLEAEGKIIHRDIGMAKLFKVRDDYEF